MKKSILIPLTAGILASGCINTIKNTEKNISDVLSNKQEQTKNMQTKIIYTTTILNYQQQQDIEKTITSYLDFFNISLPEIIISEDDTMTDKNTLAYAKPGIIYIIPKNIILPDNKNLENIILHELFHAIKSKKAIAIPPFTLTDGFTVTGFHGLSILVQKGQQKTQFGLIEDAAAEALASKFKSQYQVSNVYYANIGSLMLKMIGKGRLTTDDLIQAQKTSDVYLLIRKIANINTPTGKDIEAIMGIFNKVYSTDQDITNEALMAIESMRRK